MKKLNKLFAILIAVLGVSATAKADTSILKESEGWQKITQMPSNLGDYYFALVDKNNDLMLTMAPGVNQGGEFYTMYYRKSANPLQHKASLWTIEGTNYTFRNVEYTKLAMQTEWNAAWNYRTHDQPNPCEWTATTPAYSLEEACWTIQNGKYPSSGYLGPWNDANFADGAEVAFNKSGNNIGKFHIYSIPKTYCKDVAANATSANPVDMSVLITNSDAALAVIGMGGWTTANTITRNNNSGYDGKSGFFEFCNWGASSWEGSMTQTISSLPIGKYKVRAAGQASATDVELTLTANGVSTNLNCIGANGGNISADGSEVSSGSGVAGWQYMEVECVVIDGNLSISAYSKGTATERWANIDNFSIYYCGKDLTIYENALSSKITAAKAIDDTKLNTYVKNYLATEIAAAENALKDASRTVESLEKQTEQLDAAVKSADEIVVPYTNTLSLITSCENIVNNSDEMTSGAKNELTAAITAAKANVENATTADAINGIYNTLEAARQTYVQQADPTNGTAFDYTFKVTNPSFELGNTNGWSHPSAYDAGAKENANGNYTINGADGKYIFNIWNNSSIAYYIQQTVTGLPSGLYTLKAIVASDANHVITLTAGDKATDVTITIDKSTATEVVVENVVCSSGSLLIKASSANWFKADHFRLYYNGFDAATAQESVKSLKSQAEALVGSPMDADAAAALNAAIAGADATKTTRNELTSMIDALNAAIEAVENWRRDYSEAKALLVAALERFEADFNDGANGALRFMPAEAWNNILNAVAEAAKAKDVLDSYDGFETAANNLHAAMDAVYASYIKYDMLENLTSLIGNADCTANDAWPGSGRSTKDDQHWSGQKRIYFAQNHENGAARSQTITLPKDGTYLLKVAVRAVEAASYAEILINGVSYKTVGAHGRTGGTIATDGTEWENIQAGIDAGKTFANNNQGYGWVYTYIYFDAKAGENTIAINLSNFNSSREANCGGMELYYLRPNYTVVEDGVVEYYGEFDEVTGTAYATHDVTNATLKENSIDVTANPNTFIIANENQVSNEDNVIVDGTVASLVLNEGYAFYAATDFTATAATYSREFTKDTWLTVCLPFAYDVPENVEVETLSTVEADTKTFVFNKVDVMEANKPYIIKNGTEKKALFTELSNAEVKATPDAMSVSAEEGNAEFIGTYTTVTTDALMENDTYDILFFGTDGQLYYLSDGINQNVITIDPFRAYIRLPKGIIDWENGTAQAIARHGEGTTGIENSTLNAQPSTVIYDLMGRKVTNMVKGNMYIVNGKKVIVK